MHWQPVFSLFHAAEALSACHYKAAFPGTPPSVHHPAHQVAQMVSPRMLVCYTELIHMQDSTKAPVKLARVTRQC